MRNLIFAFSIFLATLASGQSNSFIKLKNIIRLTHPEIAVEDKLLAFNVWSAENTESREANKSFDKAYTVYEYAKLKGGEKGVVVVAINKDNLSGIATIAFTRDNIRKLISVKLEDFQDVDLQNTSNVVYDAAGNEIYKNLAASKVFSSFNQLITR